MKFRTKKYILKNEKKKKDIILAFKILKLVSMFSSHYIACLQLRASQTPTLRPKAQGACLHRLLNQPQLSHTKQDDGILFFHLRTNQMSPIPNPTYKIQFTTPPPPPPKKKKKKP